MTADNSGRIFISYRRQETAWPARQLYEVLVARFGAESVFKDVDDIEPGDDFVDRITQAVAACDVLLALIGPQWLTMTDDKGGRRLDNPDDFVRLELKAALSRGVRVVPILVDGARMPAADQLPEDLVAITRRQAVEINPVGFNTERLLTTLAAAFGAQESRGAGGQERSLPGSQAPWARGTQEPSTPDTQEPSATSGLGSAALGDPRPPVPPVPGRTSSAAVDAEPSPVPPGPGVRPGFAGSPAPEPVPVQTAAARRRPILLGAVGLALALIAVVAVWRPWTGAQASDRPTAVTVLPSAPATTPAATQPGVPSVTPSATVAADLPSPPIVAHRGGLEQHQFETQQAMEAAARDGFAVETDVRYTSDGVAVLVHDERATKGLDCGGTDIRVSQTTWSKLRATCHSKPTSVDATRHPVPTLDGTLEAIAAASPNTWVFLELKTDQTAAQRKAFLAVPTEFGLRERTVVTSAELSRLRAIRDADSSVRRMLFVSGAPVPADQLKKEKLWGVAVEQEVATAGYIKQLQAAGLTVMVWVVNDASQWAAVTARAPDLLMTAYPAKYQAWLAAR